MTYAFTTEEIEYIRHGDARYMAKVYVPQGPGPFPMVIDLHGGAWSAGDLADCDPRAQVMAARGLVVAAINFRHAADGYPASNIDINYAIRWMKANAGRFNGRADRVGLSGTSSGGHLATLAAMRPDDARYGALPLPAGAPAVDATVQAVVMQWPVINPLSRYHHARRLRELPVVPAWIGNIPERQEMYWGSEAAMAEGNPILMMERGEKVVTVPTLWIQGQPDQTHDYRDPTSPVELNEPLRFAHDFRKAGGYVETLYIDNAIRASDASHIPTADFFLRFLK